MSQVPSHTSLSLPLSVQPENDSARVTRLVRAGPPGQDLPSSGARSLPPATKASQESLGSAWNAGPTLIQRYHVSAHPQDPSSRKREGHACLGRTHERLLRKAKRCPPHFSHFLGNQVIFQPLRGKNERECCADGDKVTFLHPALTMMSGE